MDWIGYALLEQVRGRLSGGRVVHGSRVQADTFLESYGFDESPADIAYSSDLNPEDARRLVSLATHCKLNRRLTTKDA